MKYTTVVMSNLYYGPLLQFYYILTGFNITILDAESYIGLERLGTHLFYTFGRTGPYSLLSSLCYIQILLYALLGRGMWLWLCVLTL